MLVVLEYVKDKIDKIESISYTSFRIFQNIRDILTWDIVPKVVRTEDIVLDSFSAPLRRALRESADTLPRLMLFQARSLVADSLVFGGFSLAFSPDRSFSNRSCRRWRRLRELRTTISGEFRTASTSRWNVNDTLRESGRIFVLDDGDDARRRASVCVCGPEAAHESSHTDQADRTNRLTRSQP